MKRLFAKGVVNVLDRLCWAVHWTPLGCGLLNRTIYLGYNAETDEFRWEIPNRVTYPLYFWALDTGWPEWKSKA